MEIVDAYAHCGLSKYEPIEKVRAVMQKAGVSRAVLVQHMGEYDNSYIGSIVESDRGHFAGVMLVNHQSADAVEMLDRWRATGNFQGVRFPTDVFKTAPDLVSVAGDLGLVLVLYAPDGIAADVDEILKYLRLAPFTQIVVTHLGNPKLSGTHVDPSAAEVFRLAEFANAYLQISGMKMFCPYPHEPLFPFLSEAVKRFGTHRLLWGSNYPVVGEEADYQADLRLLLDGRLPMPDDAIPAVVGENAKRLWFP